MEQAKEILDYILTGELWAKAMQANPDVQKADKEFDEGLKKIESLLSREAVLTIDDLHSNHLWSYVEAAILYGMQIGKSLRLLEANPLEVYNAQP